MGRASTARRTASCRDFSSSAVACDAGRDGSAMSSIGTFTAGNRFSSLRNTLPPARTARSRNWIRAATGPGSATPAQRPLVPFPRLGSGPGNNATPYSPTLPANAARCPQMPRHCRKARAPHRLGRLRRFWRSCSAPCLSVRWDKHTPEPVAFSCCPPRGVFRAIGFKMSPCRSRFAPAPFAEKSSS